MKGRIPEVADGRASSQERWKAEKEPSRLSSRELEAYQHGKEQTE